MSLAAVQALLAGYMAAQASSQLLSAWAANMFGKRTVLVAGALLLGAGSAVCALAASPWELQAGRIVQGLGAGTAAALLPLLLRTHSNLAVRLLADGAIPLLAPAIGALFVLGASWRLTFWLAAAAALLLLVLVSVAPAAAHTRGDQFQFAELTGNPTYLRYAACHALCFGVLAAGLACLPIMVSLHLGLSAWHIAAVQAVGAFFMLLPTLMPMTAEHGNDPMSQRVLAGLTLMFFGASMGLGWNQLGMDDHPFYYLLGAWAAVCWGFAFCMQPLAAGALKAAGRNARAGLSLLQFASHSVAAAAILLTAKGNVDDAGLNTFGIGVSMLIASGVLLPALVWRSASKS